MFFYVNNFTKSGNRRVDYPKETNVPFGFWSGGCLMKVGPAFFLPFFFAPKRVSNAPSRRERWCFWRKNWNFWEKVRGKICFLRLRCITSRPNNSSTTQGLLRFLSRFQLSFQENTIQSDDTKLFIHRTPHTPPPFIRPPVGRNGHFYPPHIYPLIISKLAHQYLKS